MADMSCYALLMGDGASSTIVPICVYPPPTQDNFKISFEDLVLWEQVLGIVHCSHCGQVDKEGKPYVGHVFRVAIGLYRHGASRDTIVAGVLHDAVEDSSTTLDEIQYVAGVHVAQAVDALTHRKGERNLDYYMRILGNPMALEVKLVGDIPDNFDEQRLAALPEKVQLRLRAKYEHALDVLQGGVTC